MKPVLTLLLLLLFKIGFAQTKEKLQAKIAELKAAGIDTTVVCYKDCVGSSPRIVDPLIPCQTEMIKYLMWQKQGINWVQRFDECNNYDPQPMKAKFMEFVKGDFQSIVVDSIAPPVFVEYVKGKKQEFTSLVDHYCDVVFVFNTGNENTMKRINSYNLDKKYNYGKTRILNRNYSRNMRSPLKKLVDMVKAENLSFYK